MKLDGRRGAAIVIGVVAVGASAAEAQAKGEYDARVCGRAACRVVEHLPAFGNEGVAPIPVNPPSLPAAYYRITIFYDRTPRAQQHLTYAPEYRTVNGFGGWAKVGARFASGMRKTVRGLAPFPAGPRLVSACFVPSRVGLGVDHRTRPPIASGLVNTALAALSFCLRFRRSIGTDVCFPLD